MTKRNQIIGVACLLSLCFSIFYYCLFQGFNKQYDAQTLYFVQVGLFKNEENLLDMQASLKEDGIKSYQWKNADMNALVCGPSLDQKKTKEMAEQLKEMKRAYVVKSVKGLPTSVLEHIEKEEFEEVFKNLAYESQGVK